MQNKEQDAEQEAKKGEKQGAKNFNANGLLTESKNLHKNHETKL